MKKNTELVFILDRSGSMSGLETDTIGGFNSMLTKQKKEKGQAYVTTVLFDDRMEMLHDGKNIKDTKPITEEDYFVRGSTALLDALGKTIGNIKKKVKSKKDTKVMFIIITDGHENASREYEPAKIKKMIASLQKNKGWEFIFLGANIDAIKAAGQYGISKDRAVNYHADEKGTALNFDVVSEAVSSVRSSYKLDKKWKKRIEEDYEARS